MNSKQRSLKSSIFKGIAFSLGIFITIVILAIAAYFLYQSGFISKKTVSLLDSVYGTVTNINTVTKPLRPAKNFSNKPNPYLNSEFSIPPGLSQVIVHDYQELAQQIQKANQAPFGTQILMADGTYTLEETIGISGDYIMISSISGSPEDVIIQGGKFANTGLANLFRVTGKHFILSGVTLRNSKYHLVQIAGESDADYPVIRNCIFQDAYQQLLKVSYDKEKRPDISSDYGLVENSRFEYSAGKGPNFYIGGLDIHAGNSWVIRNNTFKGIASPSKSITEHAIHVWNNAYNTIVDSNIIENCDRGVGFGLSHGIDHPNIAYSHRGGIIKNNLIIHNDNGAPFADSGIILENSPETIIINNRIWLEHDYPNAIEYRFPSTHDVLITNNMTNKLIQSRDGGSARLEDNHTDSTLADILEQQILKDAKLIYE